MFHIVFLFFLLSASPLLTTSLQCYTCDTPFTLNYTVTSDTVPKFTGCRLINATQCIISVLWLPKSGKTIIRLSYKTIPLTNDTLRDYVLAMVLLTISPDEKSALVAHDLEFECVSWETCNDEITLKRTLRSLLMKDNFISEFAALIQVVRPFTNESAAACYEYTNTTDGCSQISLDTCQRCQININKWSSSSEEICATCPKDYITQNWVVRESVFVLNNRTRLIDHVELKCQLSGCNSIYHGNEIYRTSNITFDFGEFFQNSSNNILNI
jgi:hypothetical protein